MLNLVVSLHLRLGGIVLPTLQRDGGDQLLVTASLADLLDIVFGEIELCATRGHDGSCVTLLLLVFQQGKPIIEAQGLLLSIRRTRSRRIGSGRLRGSSRGGSGGRRGRCGLALREGEWRKCKSCDQDQCQK